MSAVSPDETGQALVSAGVKPPLAVPRRLLRMRSDAALAERFAAGDETAFDVIYERHRPVVLAVCMGVLGTPPDAEDATQETFSALAVALRTRPPAELRPWLIRVARNASIDTTRRRRHRLLTLDGEIPEVAARPHGSGKAELAVVLDGIRELPEGQRMALLMRELGGHSYTEIAEFLATDEEAVKGLIARARVGLRAYREATELSCAAARTTIAAEPDGRRYDKTIRRHLRGCASCRGYRDALRDDAKALRAALPIQAGTVATGSLSGGMLSAAKGSLISYGLTQAATTCAASACAVGAIGGMVFVAPVHRLGLPPILPVVKHTPARQPAVKAHHQRKLVVSHPGHPTTAVSSAAAGANAIEHHAAAAEKPAVTRTAGSRHHHMHVTKVVLPRLPKHHGHRHSAAGRPAGANPANQNQGNVSATPVQSSSAAQAPATQAPATQPSTTQAPATQAAATPTPAAPGQAHGNGNANGNQGDGSGHGNGNAYGSWKTAAPSSSPQTSQATAASAPSTAQTTPAQAPRTAATPATPSDANSPGSGSDQSQSNSAHGWGNGHGRWGGTSHGGGRQGSPVSAATPAAAPAPGASPATTTASTTATAVPPATAPPATPVTTAAATTTPAPTTTTTATITPGGHGHGWGDAHGTGDQAPSSAPPSAATQSTAAATPGPTIAFTSATGNGQGHSR